MNNKTILIVEDDNDLRNVYELILGREGYQIYTAINGKEALGKLDACHPNLVLLDIFMPEMNGKEFLQNVDLDRYKDMKVVVCSNTSDEALMKEMIDLGAHQIVLKSSLDPTDLSQLAASYF